MEGVSQLPVSLAPVDLKPLSGLPGCLHSLVQPSSIDTYIKIKQNLKKISDTEYGQ